MGNTLEIKAVTKTFGGLMVLWDFTVSLARGETVGLVGPNGSGKSTLFNIIYGMAPNSGRVMFQERDITSLKPNEICHLGIARTFQLIRPFTNLSVLDNVSSALLFGRRRKQMAGLRDARDRATQILQELKLEHRANSLARELVFADRRRMELARALATGPSLLLLDEVMAGLSPTEAAEMLEIMERMKRDYGLTIFMIEHSMKLITAMCDRLVVLNFGQKLAEGPPSDVLRDPQVIDAYLGE